MRIALDAMGGDNAPVVVIQGADAASIRYPDLKFLLVGDESRLSPRVSRYPNLASVSEIRHSETVVGADDKPSVALRQGRQSSMRLAIEATFVIDQIRWTENIRAHSRESGAAR